MRIKRETNEERSTAVQGGLLSFSVWELSLDDLKKLLVLTMTGVEIKVKPCKN